MPWTLRPDVTSADVDAFEALLHDIAEQDKNARNRAAYFEPTNLDRIPYDPTGEGWNHYGACPKARSDHHD